MRQDAGSKRILKHADVSRMTHDGHRFDGFSFSKPLVLYPHSEVHLSMGEGGREEQLAAFARPVVDEQGVDVADEPDAGGDQEQGIAQLMPPVEGVVAIQGLLRSPGLQIGILGLLAQDVGGEAAVAINSSPNASTESSTRPVSSRPPMT